MPDHTAPGVYVEELSVRPPPIEPADTGVAGFVGIAARGPFSARLVTSAVEFDAVYGERRTLLGGAAHAFFANGGGRLWIARARRRNPEALLAALAALGTDDALYLVAVTARGALPDIDARRA